MENLFLARWNFLRLAEGILWCPLMTADENVSLSLIWSLFIRLILGILGLLWNATLATRWLVNFIQSLPAAVSYIPGCDLGVNFFIFFWPFYRPLASTKNCGVHAPLCLCLPACSFDNDPCWPLILLLSFYASRFFFILLADRVLVPFPWFPFGTIISLSLDINLPLIMTENYRHFLLCKSH